MPVSDNILKLFYVLLKVFSVEFSDLEHVE